MSAQQQNGEQPQRPPMWKLGAFWSLTADPFLDGNSEVPPCDLGQCSAVLGLLLRDCPRLAPWAAGDDRAAGGAAAAVTVPGAGGTPSHSLPTLLQKCGALFAAAMEVEESLEKFAQFVDAFLSDLGNLPIGGVELIPGGWTNPTGSSSLVYAVERTAEDRYALVVCNASTDGLAYHPSMVDASRPAEKILYRTCLRVDNVTRERMLDRSFWAVMHSQWIKPSEFHRAEVLYDVLLPWLSGRPTLGDAVRGHYEEIGLPLPSTPAEAAAADAMKDDGDAAAVAAGNDGGPFWRTPARSSSSSPLRNLVEAARYYLVTYRGATKPDLKRLSTLLKAEALNAALADMNDPRTEAKDLPDEDERTLLELSCRTVAHGALKVAGSEGWGAADARGLVAAVKAKLAEIEKRGASEAEAEAKAGQTKDEDAMTDGGDGDGGGSIRPDPFEAGEDLAQPDSRFLGVRLDTSDVESYAGPATEPKTARSIDFLKVRGRGGQATTPEDAVALLGRCKRACEDLNRRCKDGSSFSSRVACQLQVAELIRCVVTEMLPSPVANSEVLAAQRLSGVGAGAGAGAGAAGVASGGAGVSAAAAASSPGSSATDGDGSNKRRRLSDEDRDNSPGRLWSRPFPSAELEQTCLSLLHSLTVTYAHAWQSFDAPPRSFESERAAVSLSLLAAFDCVLRHDIYGLDTASVLREDGGYCVSTSACVSNVNLYRLAAGMELHSPSLAGARAGCLAYFESVASSCKYRDLFVFRMPTDKIEMKKYGTSVLFLRKIMERCGYELVPRDNPQPPPEIESLMEWMTSPGTQLAQQQKEFGMLRDMALMYKFVCTMESRTTELQRQRMQGSEYVSWSLSFEDTSMDGRGGPGLRSGGAVLDGRALRWEVLNYRGLDLDTADVQVTVFGDRRVYFGEGGVHSPADVGALLEQKGAGNRRPTEDDVLHADGLPSYGDTLSRQESEMLMSYLTVPYMRVPLVLAFFANGDRVTHLFSAGLRGLLRAALFESGEWVPEGHEPAVETIPVASAGGFRSKLDEVMHGGDANGGNAQKKAVLGTDDGLLLNELRRAPEATLRPLMKMLSGLNDLAEASVYSPDAALCLYLIELAADVQSFFGAEGVKVGEERRDQMTRLLSEDCRSILRRWLSEAAEADDLETMCVIHAYLAVIYAHTPPENLTAGIVSEFMGSLCFVRNWHGWGLGDDSSASAGSSTDSNAAPEQRLLRFMQAHGVDISRVGKGSMSKYLGHSRPLYLRVGPKTVKVPNLGSPDDDDDDDDDDNDAGDKKKNEGGAASSTKAKKKRKKGSKHLAACVPEQKLVAVLQAQRGPVVAFLEAIHGESSGLASEVLADIAKVALDTKVEWLTRKQTTSAGADGGSSDADSGGAPWTAGAGSGSSRGSWLSPDGEMHLDLQSSQLLWRNDELKPLPDSMTSFPDFDAVFGRRQMHCGLVAHQLHRHWVHVVGTRYDLLRWDEPNDGKQGVEAPMAIEEEAAAASSGGAAGGVWVCPMCTYANPPSAGGDASTARCGMCGSERSHAQPSAAPPAAGQGNGQGDGGGEGGQPGDAADMKAKSPPVVEHRGTRYDREIDPFDKDNLAKFDDVGEAWAVKLLVGGIRGHYKDQMPFKLLLPAANIAANDHVAVAMAGVITQHETDEDEDEGMDGLPPPLRGRGGGNAFAMMGGRGMQRGMGMRQQQGQGGSKLSTTWKEFVMYRDRNVLQVFNIASHGRKMYRRLVYSSDSRLAFSPLDPSKGVFGASGDLKAIIPPDASLVVTRDNGGDAGVETLIPGRLLAGTVPGALLEAYRFWHSADDDVIRGEPLDPESTWFGTSVIEIMPDRTIIQRELSRKEQKDLRDRSSSGVAGGAGGTTSRRLKVESSSSANADSAAMETDEAAPKVEISETAVLDLMALGFSAAAAKLALERTSGNSAFAAEWLFNPDNAAQAASASDRERIDGGATFRVVGHGSVEIRSAPSAENDGASYRWRTPETLGFGEEVTVVERSGNWLRFVDSSGSGSGSGSSSRTDAQEKWVLAFDPERGTLLESVDAEEEKKKGDDDGVARAAASAAKTSADALINAKLGAEMDVDDDAADGEPPPEADPRRSKLLNVLDYPTKGSGVFRLLSLLIDIEDASHILLWADVETGAVTHIQLPRLKLNIVPRDGRLHLTDQAGWFICHQNASSKKLLDCHSLLLMNGESEQQFLVPNHVATRPKIKGKPFSTAVLCDRNSFSWIQTMDARFYLYGVHTSGTFVVSQELAASIYLVHLKLLRRRYGEAFALSTSCTVDVPLAPDEGFVWAQLGHASLLDDRHPDAHACRLRLSLAVLHADGRVRTPWEEGRELDEYLRKLPRVSACCRLSREEELEACRLASAGTPLIKNRLAALSADSPSAPADFVAATPRVGGSPWHKIQSRSLGFYDNHGTSLKRLHFKPQIGEGGFDNYAADVIFNELVVSDEESGANRQLGFAFLYQLIMTGQAIPGARTKPAVAGELLARYLHLKLSRWGRESVGTGEVEVSSSRSMAQLSALLHWQHQRGQANVQPVQQASTSAWPSLPSDERSVALASAGVNVYTEPGVSSGIKTWLDAVDGAFQSSWPSIVAANDAACRILPKHEPKEVNQLRFGAVRPADVEDTGCSERSLPDDGNNGSLGAMMARPLGHLLPKYLTEQGEATKSQGSSETSAPGASLPFDLSGHPAAQPAVAAEILKRLEDDVRGYHSTFLTKVKPVLNSTEEGDLLALIVELEAVQVGDLTFAGEAISSLERRANHIDSDLAALRSDAAHRDAVTFEILTRALMSRRVVEEVRKINGELTVADLEGMLPEVIEVLVRVNRASHAARTVSIARKLLSIKRHQKQKHEQSGDGSAMESEAEDAGQAFRAKQLAKDLAESLAVRRWYIDRGRDEASGASTVKFDPRYLVFEYVFDILLRERQVEIVRSFASDVASGRSHVQQMIMGAGKTTVVAPLLALLLADGETLVTQVMPPALLEQTRHIMRSRFGTAVLRKRVFTLEFDRGCEDDPAVALRAFRKLDAARRSRSVVCANPEAIKSLFLKFVEHLHSIENVGDDVLIPSGSVRQNKEIVALREVMQMRSDMSDCLVPIFDLWRDGVLIMDEVDVLLHPLRSELNFPIGLKDPIDLAGLRWELPTALLRAFFPEDAAEEIQGDKSETSSGAVSSNSDGGDGVALKEQRRMLLSEIQESVATGYASHALQRSPHLVLLDEEFYRDELREKAARWAALWIIENTGGDVGRNVDPIAKYLSMDGLEDEEACRHSPELQEARAVFAGLGGTATMKLLNLGRDWVRVLLPHVLAKIDRVTFGVLSAKDLANVDQTRMPLSRKLMAVPFVGKDVPSRSSEFAHPDVVIGLTVLGYRYEGLRESDIRRLAVQLKSDYARQVGPRDRRPACLLFRDWLEHAQRHSGDERHQLPVLPLPLFQANDPRQLRRLHRLLKKEDRVISYYLRQHVFPACMNFQSLKITACGFELGSDVLFRRRVGFSGTPSNLLPVDLGECLYEPGSDGRVMHVLSSPDVVGVERKPEWTARSLLRDVAAGCFHALIDTGALITGMDNEDVARYLLEHLPSSTFEGVVYLDHADRKMFLQRSSGKSLHLSQCGVDPSRRFTFYDQVHTTGMDIKQAPDARAVVTLGKDMTFRDYAQGSFRMRGIGNGQTIRLFLIPEVEHLIRMELHNRGKEDGDATVVGPLDVPAWLLVNSMKAETVQHSMLSLQELHTVWRKEALKALVGDVRENSPLLPEAMPSAKSQAQRLRRFVDAEGGAADCWIRKCVALFREPVGYVVPDGFPVPAPLGEKVVALMDENEHFVTTPESRSLMLAVAERMRHTKDMSVEALGAEIVNENEQEQQQQQEEEAEEEQQKVSRFTRDDEQANPWPTSCLNESPGGVEPFYSYNQFAVRPDQPKLAFPKNLLLTDNWFRPRWIGLGDRRLKNVLVVLEWYPKSFKLLLGKLVPLLHQHLVAEGLQPTPAALRALSISTQPMTEADADLRRRFASSLSTSDTAQDVGMGPNDSFYVAVSLSEAESMRRVLHTLQGDTTSAFSLLSIEDSSCIDSTPSAAAVTSQNHLEAMSCLRFVNGDMHYTTEELAVLHNALAGSSLKDRIQFFEQCLSLRRREKYLWGDTPLAKLFTEQAEWHLLDSRAQVQQFALSLVRSLRLPGNTVDLLSLFSRLDTDNDGCLSHAEVQRFLEELRLGFSPADIAKIIGSIEGDKKRAIPWKVLVDALMIPADLTSRQQEDQTMEDEKTVWACSNCTFRFNDPVSTECEVCGYGWDGRLHVPADKWMCDPSFGGCTMFNSKDSFFCSMCDKSNPTLRNIRF